MKNKGYAKCWGQIRCITGDGQVANKTEVFGQESTLGWAGGGSWELQDLSSFVLGENYLCMVSASFTKIFKKLFSNVLETLEFWIIQSILSPHYLSVRLDRCKLTTLIFPS